tara:strand:- start:5388 stop:6302 length:915 start_codon:yes stop_codon:yes gene_type:complete
MRYSRQELVIGKDNQRLLESKTVAIVGVGALGSVAAELLVRAGVNVILIDRDVVEESNLQRQLLFYEEDIGRSKALVAKERLEKINSLVKIDFHAIHLSSKNINILSDVDMILDCTDNLQTRFLINCFCKQYSKKWIYSAAIKNHGYVMPILDNACFNCFVKPATLDTCATVGVLNSITTSIAALQVDLCLKWLIGDVKNVLYYYNLDSFRKLKVNKREDCAVCNGNFNVQDGVSKFCSGRWQIMGRKIDLASLKVKLQKIDKVVGDEITLEFKNILLFEDGRALIKAKSLEEAEGDYAKWVGN